MSAVAVDSDMEIDSTSLSLASYSPPQPQVQGLNSCNSSSNSREKVSAAATFDSNIDDVTSKMTQQSLGRNSDAITVSSSASSSSSLPCSPPPAGLNAAIPETATNGVGNDFGISLMQSSPPPHSYRHSRAYRHFKNPPQPHMCIRTTTDAGEELFINVLSWTRIVIPQEPTDPIPLYGGMRVPPGSPRSPPIVFAVMANPEVLKDSGRHSKDPEERRAMVDLMCDFVEAMNAGVKLIRNAVILKDRDISGELKDVWNAVQAQRDREREEQILQQRQQQHYHNITAQQMFPKSTETSASSRLPQQQRLDEEVDKIAPEVETAANRVTPTSSLPHQELLDNKTAAEQKESNFDTTDHHTVGVNNINENNTITDEGSFCGTNDKLTNQQNSLADDSGSSGSSTNSSDQIDATKSSKSITKDDANTKLNSNQINASHNNSTIDNQSQTAKHKNAIGGTAASTTTTITSTSPTSPMSGATKTTATIIGSISNHNTNTAAAAASLAATTVTVATQQQPPPPPAKKDKLAGFLPNGCIFPRFKNNKHKDKDKEKEKEKEAKPKDKEKTLLNALKKNKEKKVAPIEQLSEKTPTTTSTTTTDADVKSQYEKNCINLESEMQKLDINKIDPATNNESMFIKLKVSTTSAAAK